MLTKADFQKAVRDVINNGSYPTVATLYQAGDPRIIQHIDSIAAMLAMLSAQVEVAQAEVFDKARPATILANAALLGIVPKGKPARVQVSAENRNSTPFVLGAGIVLLDSNGRSYRVETPKTIAAGATDTVECLQASTRVITHTVTGSVPFYSIELSASDDDLYLSTIAVVDSTGTVFSHHPKFTNVGVGDEVFHVESDEFQRVFVRFGYKGVVGYQPADGEIFTITLEECGGDVRPALSSPFAFSYIYSPEYTLVDLKMAALAEAGENPPSLSTLRDLCRFPSIYDESSVYLGEFDFLIRRNLPSLKFLSVWNETIEETVRGPSVDHINRLFICVMSATDAEAVLDEPAATTVPPAVIAQAAWTGTQTDIARLVTEADDTYKVTFLTPVRSKIVMTIAATVSVAYDSASVKAQIEAALIAEYGISKSSHGSLNPLYQSVYKLLRAQIAALQDSNSDVDVRITPPPDPVRPEHWRFLDSSSLTVTVTRANTVTASWGDSI